jgi:hypothetical protein
MSKKTSGWSGAKKWALGLASAVLTTVIATLILTNIGRIGQSPDGIAVSPEWPALPRCDFTAAAAGPGAEPPVVSAEQTVDRAAVAAQEGGGAWASGNLYLVVTPSGDKQVAVRSITPRVAPVDDVPEWVFLQIAQCGEISYREFELDLDAGSLRDLGVQVGAPNEEAPPPVAVGADLFVVDSSTAAAIVVHSFACDRSYDFWLDVAYTVSGSTATEHTEVGPFRVYAGDDLLTGGEVDFLGNPEAGAPGPAYQCLR